MKVQREWLGFYESLSTVVWGFALTVGWRMAPCLCPNTARCKRQRGLLSRWPALARPLFWTCHAAERPAS